MGQIGGLMFFLGLFSVGMHFLERELVLLLWIDNWGEVTGWTIRIALIVIGGGLWIAGRINDSERAE